jgi:hypothetical protein
MTIVRNIQNSTFYKHLHGNYYVNLKTGVSGEIPEEVAKKIFKINLEATVIFSEYPMVEEMVKRLGLISDKTTTEEK